ncbi:UDP-N-acetylglucosamine--N-acetylmuramyl-(pentapeptide) pyrophosphoryl-undecaprenol N-acetylglucosamine transferase [Paenibacillus yonginensis]|uniref:UDP-N-acetylglucosamine--N-acetylmuramyl-(pentapeptide) pyrophosphoryl-undecaprenol N-acetylglucosamine transferase n=1 Tax=Paenibacillus yonginensis TaxID=1462996 RepID=A0A1B1MYG3_9BACL|nr:undecaprenyldiphospho-muramoylpentapeptide beta-N-acetylglucosaminyltransferase [Paenibacillus yonginensis]ANS74224.1 UDP-N-acetylglucosamine--N-acetylmuramyl-(pentapeptide) pyrophosphoryl-undecaprenol N-acetylglucosamine transferase [Paenibacillus yonginensis]
MPSTQRKKIVFTGGGSAGHVSVNLALIPSMQERGFETYYIGSHSGIEAGLIAGLPNVPYTGISTGKLRRYLDMENLKDPFRIIKGVAEAHRAIRTLKPDIVFSKGGFVSVPVVLAASLNRVPVIIHESDITPGLANRIALPFARKVCVTFPEAARHVKNGKAVHVGAIVRDELFSGSAARGRAFCGLSAGKPIMVCMGGSLGSAKLNRVIRNNLEKLLPHFQIVHLCGKGQTDPGLDKKGYAQFEYITEQLPDVLAAADLVVSRAGSNSIFEFLALNKPMLLIPLSKAASRGDQLLNAESFRSAGYADVLLEEDITDIRFVHAVQQLYHNRGEIKARMKSHDNQASLRTVLELIMQTVR